jgi:2-polyprenyl-3-methyl-5-hydroxy-6-metoxy-1,4-benzoquinol methylase
MRFDSICCICGSNEFQPFADRADGIPVVLCRRCAHGVVAYLPGSAEAFYGDDYFSSSNDASIGYEDYPYTAEHGVSWAAALAQLLLSSGRILDIGCADGHLLRKFGAGYDRFGIELNQHAAQECRKHGINILASDVLDSNLRRDHESEFNFVLAIAVFEHVADFRGAVEAAMALLGTDGLLLFEVPLLSENDTSDPWLRTSLEHIHYPTERSLRYLFERILGLELVGSSVPIHRFGRTFVGLAAKSAEAMKDAGKMFDRCIRTSPDRLTAGEARVRCLFGVLHAAETSPEMLGLCRYLTPSDLNPLTVRRLVDLWKVDVLSAREVLEHYEQLQSYLKDVEAARDWHAEESKKRDKILAELAEERDKQLRTIEQMCAEKAEMEASWIWRLSRSVRSLGAKWANATTGNRRE